MLELLLRVCLFLCLGVCEGEVGGLDEVERKDFRCVLGSTLLVRIILRPSR